MRITFNKSDWSGEEATIDVRDNKFTFNGYDFELRNHRTEKAEDGDPKWDFHAVEFYCDGEPFGTAHRFERDAEWDYSTSVICRTHKNPAVICAIVAANII